MHNEGGARADRPLGERCTGGHTLTGVGADHWYRFIGDGGTALARRPPGSRHCGTTYPGWLSGWNATTDPEARHPPATYAEPGRIPTADEGVVEMTVCFEGHGFTGQPAGPCRSSTQVGVVQCPGEDGPLLWRLPYAPNENSPSGYCVYGYCTGDV